MTFSSSVLALVKCVFVQLTVQFLTGRTGVIAVHLAVITERKFVLAPLKKYRKDLLLGLVPIWFKQDRVALKPKCAQGSLYSSKIS